MAITMADFQYSYGWQNFDAGILGYTPTLGVNPTGYDIHANAAPQFWGINDTVDGSADGQVAFGQQVFVPLWGMNGYVYGTTPDGGVILTFLDPTAPGFANPNSGNQFNLFTNTNYALNPLPAYPLPWGSSGFTFCFAKGTLISTAEGQRPVESLNIGDEVVTAAGKTVPVKWIGRQTIHQRFAKFYDQMPIRIAAGALGDNVPSRDLFVTPDHALLVDGCVLVHASALVNGRTITQVKEWEGDIEYFHVETEGHEIILAEGAPAETFIDNVSRETFDNYAEYAALYPDSQPMTELDLPRVKFARQLPAVIQRKLMAVADSLLGQEAKAA